MNKEIKNIAKKSGFIFWSKEESGEHNKIDWSSDYSNEFDTYNNNLINKILNELDISEASKENIKNKYIKNT